ncbi:MAG: TolC family protein [Phycisphaerae bacterium]|nr:TolC family protein [Gemmatimonadaceae bacterium]
MLLAIVLPPHKVTAQPVGSVPRLTLRTVLDSARSDYPGVAAAQSRVRAADAARTTSRAFGNPMLSYSVDQARFPGAQPLVGMSRQTFITATVPLEPFYQRGARVTRANAELRAAEADAVSERQRLGLEAASAFYRVALAQIETETTRELEGWLDSVVNYNRVRVQEGVTAEADLIRATIERDRTAVERTLQSAELARSRAILAMYLPGARTSALPNGAPLFVAIQEAPFALQTTGLGIAPGQPSQPMAMNASMRSEVRSARERVAASAAGIGAERSMVFRELGATIGTMLTMNQTAMIAGLSLPIPLFDRNRGEIQRARAEYDVAGFELAATERSMNAELQGAYDAAVMLTERITELAQRDSANFLRRADESRRIALGAYREGAVPLLQVIDAAQSWANSRVTYYRALFAQQQSILALTVAQGVDIYTSLALSTATGEAGR